MGQTVYIYEYPTTFVSKANTVLLIISIQVWSNSANLNSAVDAKDHILLLNFKLQRVIQAKAEWQYQQSGVQYARR